MKPSRCKHNHTVKVLSGLGPAIGVLLLCTQASYGDIADWRWQVHYYGIHWLSGVTIQYHWTDKDGLPLGTDDPTKPVWIEADLPRCTWFNIIPPAGAEDVKWKGAIFVESKKCEAKTAALKEGNPQWITDISGFYDDLKSNGVYEFYWPSGFANADMDVYSGVDLVEYYNSGGISYDPDQGFHVVSGACSELPGFVFGTSSVYLDPVLGLVTDNPIADTYVYTQMEEGICPEPAALSLAVFGGALALLKRKRKS